MLKASDVGPGFTDGQFSTDNAQPQPCGQPNVNAQVPPKVDVGSEADSGTSYGVQEEFTSYPDAATNDRAWNLSLAGVSCGSGSISESGTTIPITITRPTDVTSQVGGGTMALKVTFNSSAFPGASVVAVKFRTASVAISVIALPGADASKIPDAVAIAKEAVAKLAPYGS